MIVNTLPQKINKGERKAGAEAEIKSTDQNDLLHEIVEIAEIVVIVVIVVIVAIVIVNATALDPDQRRDQDLKMVTKNHPSQVVAETRVKREER